MQLQLRRWVMVMLLGHAALAAGAQATDADRQFLVAASEGDFAEIRMSQLALNKHSGAAVRSFATRMIADHGQLEQVMRPFADAWGVTPATGLSAEHQAEFDRLRTLDGPAFDHAYLQMMAADHHRALAAFRSELATTRARAFRAAVQSGEKTVAQHTALADSLVSHAR